MINEAFLQFIWKFQLFNFTNLKCSRGASLQILNRGIHNHNAGPDFLNVKARVNQMLWNGDVEVHVKSSDWLVHKHQDNPHYDAVILHVVYEEDVQLKQADRTPLFCLELKGLIPNKYLTDYDTLYHSYREIPCSYALPVLDTFFWNSYTERLLVERMEKKQAQVRAIFLASNKDYQECFYRLMAYGLGLKINKDPMLRLAEATPLRILQKHCPNRLHVEALLYGQSGLLLKRFSDEYPKELQLEYLFYKEKYRLQPLKHQQWKFFRLRPNSFPTLRISYLADFILKSESVFEELFHYKGVESLLSFFNLDLSDYWRSHYVFDKKSKRIRKHLGDSTLNTIIINTVLPFCFFYAKQQSDEPMMMRVLETFKDLKCEKNKVVRNFKEAGVNGRSAMMSQGLIHLYQNYCIPRNCLNCRVLNQILK
ncbi:MAG: DUF2851 family protein [Flavobacteriales bacterium]|nr:DUF2851 family protein [Flavobacteriales bacterium]